MGRLVVHARRRTPFGNITLVRDTEDGSLRYSQGTVYQSIADRHGISLTAYTHAIAGLISQIAAHNILVIGCAGGTLGKLLDKRGRCITMIDINPECFAIASKYYGLPKHIQCQVADGAQYIRTTADSFDVIVVDVCDGLRLPAVFSSRKFLRQALERVQPGGYIVCNVILANDADRAARRIAAKLAHEGQIVTILDTPGGKWRNALIVAGPAELKRPLGLGKRPEFGMTSLRAELRAMQMFDWRISGAG